MTTQRERARRLARRARTAPASPPTSRWSSNLPPTRDGGRQAIERALALPQPPTAVVCYNDIVAMGATHALAERGLAAGRDIAVVGFDDIAEAAHNAPPLTTVSADTARNGPALRREPARPDPRRRSAPTSPSPARRGWWCARAAAPAGATGEPHEPSPSMGPDRRQHDRRPAHDRRHARQRRRSRRGDEREPRSRQGLTPRRTGSPARPTTSPALVGDPAIDAVYISTTNELHRDQLFAAAKRRQACAVREAAGADARRCARRWSPPAASAASSWAPTTICATPRRIARCARRSSRGASASRCSRACSTPSICRPICRAGASTSRRPAAASCSTSPCHDADTLRFVLDDEPWPSAR